MPLDIPAIISRARSGPEDRIADTQAIIDAVRELEADNASLRTERGELTELVDGITSAEFCTHKERFRVYALSGWWHVMRNYSQWLDDSGKWKSSKGVGFETLVKAHLAARRAVDTTIGKGA